MGIASLKTSTPVNFLLLPVSLLQVPFILFSLHYAILEKNLCGHQFFLSWHNV